MTRDQLVEALNEMPNVRILLVDVEDDIHREIELDIRQGSIGFNSPYIALTGASRVW